MVLTGFTGFTGFTVFTGFTGFTEFFGTIQSKRYRISCKLTFILH